MSRPTFCRTKNRLPEECQCFRCRDRQDDEPQQEEQLEGVQWSAAAEDK